MCRCVSPRPPQGPIAPGERLLRAAIPRRRCGQKSRHGARHDPTNVGQPRKGSSIDLPGLGIKPARQRNVVDTGPSAKNNNWSFFLALPCGWIENALCWRFEFRPNDLAMRRDARLTNDIL